jgi:hypothetical protein
MDFTFQTPMLFLANTQTNNNPYLYFYNIPFLIFNGNSPNKQLINSEIFLNDSHVNIILPLNSNQFFNKQVSTLYECENLLILTSHFNLVTNMSQQFDILYNDPLYSSIINTLEQAKQLIINLNINFINDTTYYGKTSQTVLDNILPINKINLINYNVQDYSYYNKLFIDIYGNNPSLISNSVIQGLVVNIYNYPSTSYLPNRKISNDLIYYLQNIPKFFQNQITYISKNTDYMILTNKNEYLEKYTSLNSIIGNININAYDNNGYEIKLLYPVDSINFSGIYYDNLKIDISNIIDKTTLISYNFNKIINFDKQYSTEIIKHINNSFDNNKFNYLGPVYINNNNIKHFYELSLKLSRWTIRLIFK